MRNYPESLFPSDKRVLLVTLPWGSVNEPNIGLGILKSVLRKSGIGCDVLYGTMRMLRYLKPATYQSLGDRWGMNDFPFAGEFDPGVSEEQKEWLLRILTEEEPLSVEFGNDKQARLAAQYLRLREEIVPQFLDELMDEIDLSKYAYVGLSCLFDQTMSSLALAHRIKQKHPGMMIVFGGYALQRPVGPALQKSFAEMDVVAYGDGEAVVVPLYEAAIGLRSLAEVPNITYRDSDGSVRESSLLSSVNLDESPTPDYDDFFVQRKMLKQKHGLGIQIGKIPVESSRGCWYGAKNHCTFCGIDDETLRYRSKSAVVVESQLDELNARYGVRSFRFSDYIMPRHHLRDFLPRMRERGAPWHLHYETKANLKDREVKLCSEAGVVALQPGIESLSSDVLKLMCKGVRAMQNVLVIYTMTRYRIIPAYNFIFGFPFEVPKFYFNILKLIPALHHLHPPETVVPALITRFAPLHEDPERFGGKGPLVAHHRYEHVFSKDYRRKVNLSPEDWCYVFENPYAKPTDELAALHEALLSQVYRWTERYRTGNPRLTFQSIGEEIVFEDTRYSDEGRCVSFGRHHQALSCVMPGAIWTEARLMTELASHGGDSADYLAALRELVEERFVLREDDQYVWIAFGQDWDFADPDDSRRFDHRILESDLIDPSSWDGRDETFNQYVGGGADSLLRVL